MKYSNGRSFYLKGTSGNQKFLFAARKHRPENRSLRGVNEDSRTELASLRAKMAISGGALKFVLLILIATLCACGGNEEGSSSSMSSAGISSSKASSSLTSSSGSVLSSSSTISSSIRSSSSNSSSSASSVFIGGLDQRPVSTSCLAGESPSSGKYELLRVWSRVRFSQPIGLVQMPGGPDNDYYVMEKGGRILRLSSNFNSSSASVFLDLREVVEPAGEGGVLSMAFHPNFPAKPYVYIAHMDNDDDIGFVTRISRFTTEDGLTAADEKVVFNLPQNLSPYGKGSIHNAGTLAFGPDGYLYMSVGDDKRTFTAAGDPSKLYGTIIRLDVNTEADDQIPYIIPPSNPLDNEIFAYGFRNPWRLSFDRVTGDLWAGDVGEECFEEINRVEMGKNYGWPNWEADVCGPGQCQGENTLPVYQYHTAKTCGSGNSVTGGYVYRGKLNPSLVGRYVFGDYQTGQIWAYDTASQFTEDLFVTNRSSGLAAFGEDNDGELFHIDIVTGRISRIQTSTGVSVAGPPENLADTNCFASIGDQLVPATGVLPYSIAQPFWSDGAEKERYLSLPEGTSFTVDALGDWEMPVGGVLIKNFKWQGKNFETRFFVRYNNGSYGAYTYKWNSGSQATLVPAEGEDIVLSGGQPWHYPSRNECRQCHNVRSNYILGPETRQMNIDHRYPSTGRTANQFKTMVSLDMVKGEVAEFAPFPALTNASVSVEERALSYIHVNCASCHRGTGGAQSIWDARYTTAFENKGLCRVSPITPVTDFTTEYYVHPGSHESSSIWWRASHRGESQMPNIGTYVVDQTGVDLIANWIDAMPLTLCPPEATEP